MVQTKSSRKKYKKSGPKELPTSAVAYPISRWPSDVTRCRNGNSTYTMCIQTETALTSSGSGIIASVFPDVVTSVNNWLSLAAVFDAHRVLGFQVHFSSLHQAGGATATFFAPIATVIDRSDSTVLASYLSAAQYSSFIEHAGGKSFSVLSAMASTEDASFQSTANPQARAWIKFYSTGNTISLTVGRVTISYLVQFRALGVN